MAAAVRGCVRCAGRQAGRQAGNRQGGQTSGQASGGPSLAGWQAGYTAAVRRHRHPSAPALSVCSTIRGGTLCIHLRLLPWELAHSSLAGNRRIHCAGGRARTGRGADAGQLPRSAAPAAGPPRVGLPAALRVPGPSGPCAPSPKRALPKGRIQGRGSQHAGAGSAARRGAFGAAASPPVQHGLRARGSRARG